MVASGYKKDSVGWRRPLIFGACDFPKGLVELTPARHGTAFVPWVREISNWRSPRQKGAAVATRLHTSRSRLAMSRQTVECFCLKYARPDDRFFR